MLDLVSNVRFLVSSVRYHRYCVRHEFQYPDFARCLFHALVETAEYIDAAYYNMYPGERRAKSKAPDPVLELGQAGYMLVSALALRCSDDEVASSVKAVYDALTSMEATWQNLMRALLDAVTAETDDAVDLAIKLTIKAFAVWLRIAEAEYGAVTCIRAAMANIDKRITYHRS